MDKWKNRIVEFPCDNEFLSRVSTRAFDLNKDVSYETLMSCFEAAKWAPSSFNGQPWRYVYARSGSKSYNLITDCLIEFNKSWCKFVPIIVIVCSRKRFLHNDKPSPTASLDTGASYMSFVLEAHKRGLATHAMAGFDVEKLRQAFEIPDSYTIEALLACGYPAPASILPIALQEKETPSQRLKLEEFVSEGVFKFK